MAYNQEHFSILVSKQILITSMPDFLSTFQEKLVSGNILLKPLLSHSSFGVHNSCCRLLLQSIRTLRLQFSKVRSFNGLSMYVYVTKNNIPLLFCSELVLNQRSPLLSLHQAPYCLSRLLVTPIGSLDNHWLF